MTKDSTSAPPPAGAAMQKHCAICGRLMSYRPRWAKCWHSVRTCSAACRSAKLTHLDRALEEAIITLLQARRKGASICPSEASRAVFGQSEGLAAGAMRRTRYAANRLAAAGRVKVTQRGRELEPSTAKGPIRLILAPADP